MSLKKLYKSWVVGARGRQISELKYIQKAKEMGRNIPPCTLVIEKLKPTKEDFGKSCVV